MGHLNCSSCNGSGGFRGTDRPCPYCSGRGWVNEPHTSFGHTDYGSGGILDWIRETPFNLPLGILGGVIGVGETIRRGIMGEFASPLNFFLTLTLSGVMGCFMLGRLYRLWIVVFVAYILFNLVDIFFF